MRKYIALGCIIAILTAVIITILYPKHPLVSVVLPTYNRKKYLERSINSLLKQTYSNFEIVIVDDGSTDETQSLLKEYQKQSKKIKVITHPKNKGVSEARNTGNKNAKGKYIAIMDSDDFAMPDFLEKAVSFMEQNPHVTVGIPVKNEYTADQETSFWNPESKKIKHVLYYFVKENYFGNTGNIFKRDFIFKHNINYKNTYSCGEDYDFWMQMLFKGATFTDIPTPDHLVVYRKQGGLSQDRKQCLKTDKLIQGELNKKLGYPANLNMDMCHSLSLLLNKFPNVFLDKEKERIRKRCPAPTETFIKLKHSRWRDYLIFKQNPAKVFRKLNNDSGKVISFHPNKEITIKWDKWGIERFNYVPQNDTYHFKKN